VKAEQMIAAFKAQAIKLQAQIDALVPTPAQAAERAERQNILAGQVRVRLEIDRALDGVLQRVREILRERAAVTAKMREAATALEFASGLNLDDARFESLLRALPEEMARDSAKWVTWFLGSEEGRSPYIQHWGDVTLPETLASNNAFRTGELVEVTKEEQAQLERIIESRRPPAPPASPSPRKIGMPAPEAVAPEKIQWGLMRESVS
jgi:hypothetical protein